MAMNNHNHPRLNYKPGVTLDHPIGIYLAAADWPLFMAWAAQQDHSQVAHLLVEIRSQMFDLLFTPESRKAAEAFYDQVNTPPSSPLVQALENISGFPISDYANRADMKQTWVIECAICGSRDEYPPEYSGELTCTHNSSRRLVQMIIRPIDED